MAPGKYKNQAPQAAGRGAQSRVLRIIGGAWRGRKLRFPAGIEIRPTPDRVRETLFNWLGPRIVGMRGLDLFAGSGALGLEAISRGAAFVAFVEQEAAAARELRARLEEWGVPRVSTNLGGGVQSGSGARSRRGEESGSSASMDEGVSRGPAAHVERGDALRVLAQPVASLGPGGPFDVVFLDPPFGAGLLPEVAARLERNGWLRPDALIYLECAASQGLPELPPAWRLLKQGRAGEVGYHLLQRAAE